MATMEKTATRTSPTSAPDRVPPQAPDAEVAVLGAMLLDSTAMGAVTEILDEQAFYRGAHRKIFAAMLDLFAKDEAVDLVTLTQELKKRKQLDDVGVDLGAPHRRADIQVLDAVLSGTDAHDRIFPIPRVPGDLESRLLPLLGNGLCS